MNKQELIEKYQKLQIDKFNAMNNYEKYRKEADKYFNQYEQHLSIAQYNEERFKSISDSMEEVALKLEELGVYEYEI